MKAFAILILIAALVIQLGAQTRFRGEIELVGVGVTVVDRKGDLITDLTKDDFDIYEDGRLQTVRYFVRGTDNNEDATLHLGLLFDTSGSMEKDISLSRTAAIKFLNALPDAEDMTLVEFNTEVRLARYSQDDFARLVERIRGRKPDGYTALYDALGVYLANAAEVNGRKILVLYSDGGDTRSSASWSDTLDLLKASDVTIYVVGFLQHQTQSSRTSQGYQLREIAGLTGGQAFFPNTAKDVDAAYDKVLAELRAQYTFGYVSTNAKTDGRWRKVEIRLKRPDLKNAKTRSRNGYYAPLREAVAR
jgi:Ca-activated chloride channel family protein